MYNYEFWWNTATSNVNMSYRSNLAKEELEDLWRSIEGDGFFDKLRQIEKKVTSMGKIFERNKPEEIFIFNIYDRL